MAAKKYLSLDLFAAGLQAGTVKGDDPDIVVLQTAIPRVRAVDEEGDGGAIRIEFVITDESVDRENDIIKIDGWDLDEYKKNPVVLWAHSSRDLPVGRAVTLERNLDTLRSVAEFTPRDLSPFGHMVGRMYKEGFLNAVSVGFRPTEYSYDPDRGYGINFLRQTLLEYSAVPVPANPNALAVARAAGIDLAPYVEFAERLLDEGDESEERRDRLVAVRSMARVKGRPVILAMGAWAKATAEAIRAENAAKAAADATTTAAGETDPPVDATKAGDAETKPADGETTAADAGAVAERATIAPAGADDEPIDLDSHARSFVDVVAGFKDVLALAVKAGAPAMAADGAAAVIAACGSVVDALKSEDPVVIGKEAEQQEGTTEKEAGVIVIADDTPDPEPIIRMSDDDLKAAITSAVDSTIGKLTGRA